MVNLAPIATALRKLFNRVTTEPDYAFLSSQLVNPTTGAIVAKIDPTTGKFQLPLGSVGNSQVITAASGAITIKFGTVILNRSSAIAATLAAPTAITDDYSRLLIESITAQAHTVTQTTPGFNNGSTASDVATFGTAIGNNFEIIAYQGVWYVIGTPAGVTIA